jgi:dihydrodipicolinate synthase/N-acetylneuraminate lyase
VTPTQPSGVWAAIPTPFDDDDRFDEGVFRENLRRLAAAGVHGVYTSDADGEFYALELHEFRAVVDVLADEAERLSLPCQVGVSWSHTRGILDRLQHCVIRGISGAHVGHPSYMTMTHESLLQFWRDVAAAVPGDFGLVHYNTPKMPNYLRGLDYAVLRDLVPGLVGTKYVGSDVVEFGALVRHAPSLAHLVGEQAYGFLAPYGAAGICSWFANFNPRFVLDWHADVVAERWDEVVRRQVRMLAFVESTQDLIAGGHEHAAIGKAIVSASDFLVSAPRLRRPYLPIPVERVDRWKRDVQDRFPDMLN